MAMPTQLQLGGSQKIACSVPDMSSIFGKHQLCLRIADEFDDSQEFLVYVKVENGQRNNVPAREPPCDHHMLNSAIALVQQFRLTISLGNSRAYFRLTEVV